MKGQENTYYFALKREKATAYCIRVQAHSENHAYKKMIKDYFHSFHNVPIYHIRLIHTEINTGKRENFIKGYKTAQKKYLNYCFWAGLKPCFQWYYMMIECKFRTSYNNKCDLKGHCDCTCVNCANFKLQELSI